jgi:polysaccharide pyruvyl transferase WcaK-like protein
MVSNRIHKIAVLGHCGNANLGDDALFAAVVQNVRARQPDAEIVGFTIDPEDSRQRHGVPAYPIRRPADSSGPGESVQESGSGKLNRAIKKVVPGLAPFARACRRVVAGLAAVPAEVKFLRQSYRRLRGTELLLVAGSQQLSDHFGGPWGFPYTVFKFTFLSKLTGTKVALLSVGVGPLRSPLSRFFARRVLNMVTYRSYRDVPSTRLAVELGVKGAHPVLPDLVYSLELPSPKPTKAESDRPVVGVNPIPFYDSRYWHIVDDERYGKYVCEFTKFADWAQSSEHALLFFPTQMRSDPLTIADIRNGMQEPNSPNVLPGDRVDGVQDLINEISRADIVVANRYHGMLFALAMGKPVLGLIYQEKGRSLMEDVGQGEYVLEAADLKGEDMIARFKSMEANAGAIREQISSRLEPIRKSLQEQYDTALRLIGIEPLATPVANATNVQPPKTLPQPVQPVVEVSH